MGVTADHNEEAVSQHCYGKEHLLQIELSLGPVQEGGLGFGDDLLESKVVAEFFVISCSEALKDSGEV